MKRTFLSITLLILVFTLKCFSQSLADLERDPSFKGITIGAPISKYSDILSFSHVTKGKNVYKVYDSHYLSIFNVSMQEMLVVENNGRVYGIFLSKTMAPDNNGYNIFNPNVLLSWYSNLRSRYGNNSFSLDDMSGTPSVCGMRWKASNVVLDIVYLFYGTAGDERPQLQYSLYQREDDY